MEGAAVAKPQRKQQKSAKTSDFEALNVESSPAAPSRKAPNPLRSARPERLEAAREEVMRIITARRNGLAPPER
jgi:hypothetical protein